MPPETQNQESGEAPASFEKKEKAGFDLNSPYVIILALAAINYLWYLLLDKILLWLGHSVEKATIYSFFIWFFTLPVTFWLVYYSLIKNPPEEEDKSAEE